MARAARLSFHAQVKPADHPEFFRWPAPEGRSRESTIRLDENGHFWHDGARVEHLGMQKAFASWIALHPEDGRFILTNGWDWTYFTVDDVPFFVKGLHIDGDTVQLRLSDDSREELDPTSLSVADNDAVYVRVKQGRFDARFTPEAQTGLGPLLAESDAGEPVLSLAGVRHAIPARRRRRPPESPE